MKNIIFLDIDGVLNSLMGCAIKPHTHLWKPNVKLFHETIKQIPDCKIVISSSWRGGDYQRFLQFVERMGGKKLFKPLEAYIHPDYATVRLHGKKRGYEIREWLSRHPEVEKYICLDDDSDFFRSQPLLLIDRDIGFSYRDKHIVLMYFGVVQPDERGYGMRHIAGDLRYKKRVVNHRQRFGNKFLPVVPEEPEFLI